jgi:hypothetical protein
VRLHLSVSPAALALLLCACPSSSNSTTAPTASAAAGSASTAGSASAAGSAAAASSASATASAGAKVPLYQGPTGTLRGRITVTGDPAPSVEHSYPKDCAGAAATYGKLFRVGQDSGLADAMVAVTGYKGRLEAKNKTLEVTIKDCSWSRRTYVVSPEQHLSIRNLDALRSYLPHLDGARTPASVVAIPRGDAVPTYHRGPGRYWLRDKMGRSFMVADVFVLRYPTAAVSDLNGSYRIEGIPIGKAKVSVMLPAAKMKAKHQSVEIREGDNELDVELTFSATSDTPDASAPPAASSATAATAPSAAPSAAPPSGP